MSFAFPGFESFFVFGQSQADALAKSSAAGIKAIETVARAQQAVLTRSLDKSDAALKALLTVKSPTELAEWQSHLARDSFANVVEEGRALTELTSSAFAAVLAPFHRSTSKAA